jgi:hypothetical protein
LGIFGGAGGGAAYPPPAPLPPAPEPVPTYADESVKRARDEAKKRAQAMAGYASTIATGGQGLMTPASTTAGKTALGQ